MQEVQSGKRKGKSTPFSDHNSRFLRQQPGADAALHVMPVQAKHETGMHVQIGLLHRKMWSDESPACC